jgi:hypothetical protein
MRSRILRVLPIVLLFALVACSKKPAETASNSASQNTTAPSTAPSNDAAPPTANNSATPGTTAAEPTPVPPPPQPIVVPIGTTLTVKLTESLGSKLSSAGDTFKARLASNITIDGNVAIPAGAPVRGRVVDAQPLGKLKGGALLIVKLTSITVNGSDQSMTTSSISRTKKGKGKRTAAMAGGGTAFGAIVGGLAGGGKGAAIGALAGGGAGTAGAAYTGNDDIVLPAESALSFKLRSALTVNPAQ